MLSGPALIGGVEVKSGSHPEGTKFLWQIAPPIEPYLSSNRKIDSTEEICKETKEHKQ